MEMLGTLDGLRNAAAYRVMRKGLKWTGVVPLIIGLFCTVFALNEPELAVPGLIVGAIFVAEAVWTFTTTNPIALVINGILLTLAGFGLTAGIIWDLSHGGKGGRGIILGLVIGFWGIATMARYKKFKIALANLEPMSMTRVDELVNALKKAKLAEDSECIKFVVDDRYEWKGRFFSDAVLLMNSDVLFLPKAGFNLERKDPVPAPDAKPGKKVKVIVKMGERSETGTMEPQYVQRYESWKGVNLNALKMASSTIG